jgi:hypothetical protein
MSRSVVINDGLRVGTTTLAQESPAAMRISRLISAPGPLTVRLRMAGVRYVIVDAGPLLATGANSRVGVASLAARARLPDAEVVLASRDLVVFLLADRQ